MALEIATGQRRCSETTSTHSRELSEGPDVAVGKETDSHHVCVCVVNTYWLHIKVGVARVVDEARHTTLLLGIKDVSEGSDSAAGHDRSIVEVPDNRKKGHVYQSWPWDDRRYGWSHVTVLTAGLPMQASLTLSSDARQYLQKGHIVHSAAFISASQQPACKATGLDGTFTLNLATLVRPNLSLTVHSF